MWHEHEKKRQTKLIFTIFKFLSFAPRIKFGLSVEDKMVELGAQLGVEMHVVGCRECAESMVAIPL